MLALSGLTKTYPNGYTALGPVGLEVAPGEIVAVVGASGCGKSTFLRLIAGLDRPSRGSVRIAGWEVTGPSREVGVVFQEPRLMPWLAVRENIAFGLAGLPRAERRRLAETAIDRV